MCLYAYKLTYTDITAKIKQSYGKGQLMSSVAIGLRVEKTDENEFGWNLVNAIPTDVPCIVCLGGNGAITDKSSNSYAGDVDREITAVIGQKVPVYSVKYDFSGGDAEYARRYEFVKHRQENSQDEQEIIKARVTNEEINPKYIDELYKKLIEPRLFDAKTKKLLPTNEACRRLRMMTFVAHCHGAYVALKLEDKMQAEMKKAGCSLEDRKKIQSQMMILAYAPACPLGIANSQMISFKTVYDEEQPQISNWFNHYVTKRRYEEKRRFLAEQEHKEEDIKKFRWFDFKPCYFGKKQGNLFMIKNAFRWNEEDGPWMINTDEHNRVDYNIAFDHTQEGKIMTWYRKAILFNAVKNSLENQSGYKPLPPLEELILPPVKERQARYKEFFAEMAENGKNFRKEVCAYAVAGIKRRRDESEK